MAALSKFLETRRTRRILPYLTGSVLDIGCGYNPFLQHLKPGARYVGVDHEDQIIDWLRKQYPRGRFVKCDLNAETLALDETFDRIVMMAVIEHLDHPETVLKNLLPNLAPGGKLLMTTPSPLGDFIHHYGAKLNLFSRLAAEEHNIIFDRACMERILTDAGYRLAHYETFLFGGNQLVIAEPAR